MANKFENPWDVGGEEWESNALNHKKANNSMDQNSIDEEENYTGIFYTVYNKSDKSIWCKNEDDSGVFEVKSGKKTKRRIDGLTHWNKRGEVFKIVTGLDVLFGIVVSNQGLRFSTAMWPLDEDINTLFRGGWLSSSPDAGWDPIFEKAQ